MATRSRRKLNEDAELATSSDEDEEEEEDDIEVPDGFGIVERIISCSTSTDATCVLCFCTPARKYCIDVSVHLHAHILYYLSQW